MGQSEIINCLKKSQEPLSRKEISDLTGYNPIKVSHIINKLLKGGDIKCIELDRIQAGERLGLGRPFRRTRFYYL